MCEMYGKLYVGSMKSTEIVGKDEVEVEVGWIQPTNFVYVIHEYGCSPVTWDSPRCTQESDLCTPKILRSFSASTEKNMFR